MLRSYVDRMSVLASRLVQAGLLSADVCPEELPAMPQGVIERGIHLGDEPKEDGSRTLLPPYLCTACDLDQVRSCGSLEVISRWKPMKPFGLHVVYGAVLSDQTENDLFMPAPLGFGDAACILAQFPSLERCRVVQPRGLSLQAYKHPGLERIVLDNAVHGLGERHATLRLMWNGGRTLTQDHAMVLYDMCAIRPIANPV